MKHPLRIAVADDEPDMRDYFEKMLPRIGHTVVGVAENGRRLVELCVETQPDLVITDIRMPLMDGIDAANEIARLRSIPVILVSAFHDPELIERAESDHVLSYLIKPIKIADLETAIALASRRYEQFLALRAEAADLRQALEDRKVIERAKGVLMKKVGLSEPAAFRRLQKVASDQNKKLIDVAQSILLAEKAMETDPRGASEG